GRHKGRLGALAVQLPDGTQFSVGTGFTDAQRESPPPAGSVITIRYQELTDRGVPRVPSFVRVRADAGTPGSIKPRNSQSAAAKTVAVTAAMPAAQNKEHSSMQRSFEFVDGKSAKFWEVNVHHCEVTVRYGRIGTQGQANVKTFADEAAAQRHA